MTVQEHYDGLDSKGKRELLMKIGETREEAQKILERGQIPGKIVIVAGMLAYRTSLTVSAGPKPLFSCASVQQASAIMSAASLW